MEETFRLYPARLEATIHSVLACIFSQRILIFNHNSHIGFKFRNKLKKLLNNTKTRKIFAKTLY